MNAIISQNKLVFINSLLLAFFVDIQCVNQFLVTFSSGFDSVMTLMYIGITALIFASGIFTEKLRANSANTYYFIVLIYILAFYFLTPKNNGTPYTSFPMFLVFTIVAYLIPLITYVNPKIVIKATMLIPVPAVFRINEIFVMNMVYADTISMGQSYAFLVPIVASIINMAFYFKYDSRIQKLLGIIGLFANFIFLIQLLFFGSRGPVLALLLLVALIFIIQLPSFDGFGVSFDKKRLLLFSISLIFIIASFEPIMEVLSQTLASKGMTFNFIEKILSLSESGDITNGRSEIFPVVLNGFLENPIFGNGFDLFNKTGMYSYPHNFLYQTVYDGGLLMICLVTVPSVYKLIISLKTSNYNTIILLLFIFFISVPGATFSGDLWQQGNLWLLTGMLLSNNRLVSNNLNM